MSAASGVPPWARPVLEALLGLGEALLRHGDDGVALDASKLGRACLAALAPEAGTPEGERVEGWTGKPGPCPNCGAIRNERDAHFCSSTRSAPAPLAESGAAAPPTTAPETSTSVVDAPPDAELAGLLNSLIDAITSDDDNTRASSVLRAIHAHVERVKREAREHGMMLERGRLAKAGYTVPHEEAMRVVDAMIKTPAPALEASAGPATEDARETAFCDALHQFACEMLNRGQESRGWTVHEHKRSAQIEGECRDELLRLYRAATGEVMGTAELYDSHVGHLQETHPYPRDAMIPVDLVRREKEGE